MTIYPLRRILPLILGTIALFGSYALPANAQATRTWVSGVGDDANPCSRTAPCKTFAGAISKTTAGGEIDALDPGGFGAITITKSITIQGLGVQAGVLVSGTNGIVVAAAATDTVNLFGLEIVASPPSATSGVLINSAGTVNILNCKIRYFATAINVAAAATASVTVTDTALHANTTGVLVASPTSSAVLDNLSIVGTGAAKTGIGVSVTGSTAKVVVNNSTIYGNGTGLSATTGELFSYGNNRINLNGNNGQANQTVLTFK